jgi:hypothetical protein
MRAREQIQDSARELVRDIIQFDRLHYGDWQNMCYDIQKTYGTDDYVDLLWNLRKICGTLDNNEEALDALTDAEIAEVEQNLLRTAQIIGLSKYGAYSGNYCFDPNELDEYFPGLDKRPFYQYLTQATPIDSTDFLRNMSNRPMQSIQPRRIEMRPAREPPFASLPAEMQMERLRRMHREAMAEENPQRKGDMARALRTLRGGMKLRELFAIDNYFMNWTLRDFLNVNDQGVDHYVWAEMRREDGWKEAASGMSLYHQSTAPRTFVLITANEEQQIMLYTRLHAKFNNPIDGREAIFAFDEGRKSYIGSTSGNPDRSTYNYREDNWGHILYDVRPFEADPPPGFIHPLNPIRGGRALSNPGPEGNSHYWSLYP